MKEKCQFLIGKVQQKEVENMTEKQKLVSIPHRQGTTKKETEIQRNIETLQVSIPHRQGTTKNIVVMWLVALMRLCQFLIGKVQHEKHISNQLFKQKSYSVNSS